MATHGEPVTFNDTVTGRRRLQSTDIALPFCYGTVAFWLGKKADEYHSHRWTVYVRDPENRDLSHVVDKVVFKLHDSFEKPVRVVEAPPFELTETGWGEFEIGITWWHLIVAHDSLAVHFHHAISTGALTLHFKEDSGEKPVEMHHPLKLYEDQMSQDRQSTKKPVVVEHYDEVVFSEPQQDFAKRVKEAELAGRRLAPYTEITPSFPKHLEVVELSRINQARKVVLKQIHYLTSKGVAAA